ncbi:MAG: hypothetical protein NTZ43_11815 [Gemmatimonadetes bacterium]|nr:hypothetical protein [Gemmatimonadota bacterium]
MSSARIPLRATAVAVLVFALAACSKVGGIDASLASPISNDATYATLGYMWSGVRAAIAAKREPSTDTFSLPLSYQVLCTRGGSGSYQGTLAGSKTAGNGTATLTMTGSLAGCQFDDKVTVTEITASGISITGSVAIANDTWGAINLHMVATSVTVNGIACPGGVDVIISGTSPSAQPTSTGVACGRSGAVPLP